MTQRTADRSSAISTPPFLMIAGPTAVGKTAVGMELARQLNGEIISADSRQVYRRIDTATAKPSRQQQEQVPHHFIDERDLEEEFSAGDFQRQSEERIAAITSRDRTPIVVGGSTLYLDALVHGLADIPDVDPDVRTHLEERLQNEGAQALYDELRQVDPEGAETLDPTKTQRLIRFLEVYHGTGKPITHYHDRQPPPSYSYVRFVLNRDRKKLHNRINRRVDEMIERGLVDEVHALRAQGYSPDNTKGLRTIGYKEVYGFLRDEYDRDEMIRLIKRNTRRYAKRQLTWFRRDEDNVWYHIDEGESARSTATALLLEFRKLRDERRPGE